MYVSSFLILILYSSYFFLSKYISDSQRTQNLTLYENHNVVFRKTSLIINLLI